MPPVADPFAAKLAALFAILDDLPGAVVAFSGGVDSTALLHAATARLGARVLAVTADSPSLPRVELQDAEALARQIGARHVLLATDELQRDGYRLNGSDRCYHCKKELFVRVAERRSELCPAGWPVLYGAILDDLGDHRPGQRAAAEYGVMAPLLDAGFAKTDVRRYSREVGLPTADKPSFACLSSRVPYGTAIDAALLSQVERGELVLRQLGFRQFRLRHHGDVARVEVAPEELPRALELRQQLVAGIKACGYLHVALDLQGYRSGAMNEGLPR